jgi:hypothetical protein
MTTTTTTIETARWISEHDPLPVITYDHSPVNATGFDPRSPYVETYWLAVLGPSAILAVRRMADWLEGQPSGIVIGLEDLAHSLGLGHSTGRNAPVVRTLDRLVMFGLAQIAWDAYGLRRTIPPLAPRQLRRLPGYLAERHDADLRVMAATAADLDAVVPLRP